MPVFSGRSEVAVGSRNYTHVDVPGMFVADSLELSFLENPQ
jgi:hypothetical protein